MIPSSIPSSIQHKFCSPIEEPGAVPLLYGLYLISKLPIMRSKSSAKIPDQPNRAAMRARRVESEMKISQLQQTQGIRLRARSDDTSVESSPEDDFFQLADVVASISDAGMSVLHHVAEVFGYQWVREVSPYSQFLATFSGDFEIHATDAAKAAGDLRGMIIIFGEIHDDYESLHLIAHATHHLLGKQSNAKVFMEGNQDVFCEERLLTFALGKKNCVVLEKDSKYVARLEKLRGEALEKSKACANVVCKDLGLELDKKLQASPWHSDYAEFVNKYYHSLSQESKWLISPMMDDYNKAKKQWSEALDKYMPKRDQHMASGVRQGRILNGINFFMVGAAHSRGLYKNLDDLPCISMIPHNVISRYPDIRILNESEQRKKPEL